MGRHSTPLDRVAAPLQPASWPAPVAAAARGRPPAPPRSPALQHAPRRSVHEVVEDETPIPDSLRRPVWRVLQHDGPSVAPDLTGRSLLTDAAGRSRARRAVRSRSRRAHFKRRDLLLCAAAVVVFGTLSAAAALDASGRTGAPVSGGVSADRITAPEDLGTALGHPAPVLYENAAEARSASAAARKG